jgi:SPOR domain
MNSRFALPFALLFAAALAGCAEREAKVTHAGPPVYRDQDLMEASADAGHHLDTSERLGKLETEMTAVKIELSRLSGAAQRIEARQLQAGVTAEPASASATPIEDGKPRKHGRKAAAEKAVAEAPDPAAALAVSDKALAAIQETAHVDQAAPPAAAPVAKTEEPKPAPAEVKAASAAPPADNSVAPPPAAAAPPTAASAPGAAGNPGFGLQLGAYGSADRAIEAWNGLKDQGGKLLSDLLPKHESVTVAGKTMYRLKAGPLPDEATARSRCDGLKAQNIQCLVAPFSGEWPSS